MDGKLSSPPMSIVPPTKRHWIARIIPDTRPSGYAKIRSRRIFPAQKTAGMALFGLSASLREIPEVVSVRKPPLKEKARRQRTLTLENDEVGGNDEVVGNDELL